MQIREREGGEREREKGRGREMGMIIIDDR
jgi:hypothetical protein